MSKSLSRIRALGSVPGLNFNWKPLKKAQPTLEQQPDDSWFTRVPLKLDYNFTSDLLAQLDTPRHRSFNRCYHKTLSAYGNGLFLQRQKVLKLKLNDKGHHNGVNDPNVKVIANSLRGNNSFLVRSQRLKVERINAPFYIHQQFQINLASKNLKALIQLYFELATPRAMHLKRTELEAFIGLLLNFKPEQDPELVPIVIKAFEDLFYNGDKITLTKKERVKLFSLYVFEAKRASTEANRTYQRMIHLKRILGIDKTNEVWIILNANFPTHTKAITAEMCKHIGVNRFVLPMIIRGTSSAKQLHNVLKLVKIRNIHIDAELLNLILDQFTSLGMVDDSTQIINAFLIKFAKGLNPARGWRPIGRRFTQDLDVLNLARAGVVEMKAQTNKHSSMDRALVPYPIVPSPLTVGKVLNSGKLSNEQLLGLILNVKINGVPLAYHDIHKLITSTHDFDCLRTILEIVITVDVNAMATVNTRVREFNEDLYKDNAKSESLDERQWLVKILKAGVETHDRIIENGAKAIDELVRNRVQSLLVDLNAILNK